MPRRSAWLDEVDLSSDIDKLYLNGDKETLKRTLNEFKKNKGLKSFRLASSKNIDRVIEEISQLGDDEISPSLFNDYSDNLRKAVDQVFKRNNGNGLDDQLRANVSRFAAYKAMLATGEIREQIKAGDMTRAKMAARAHNRTQATEYNTTVSRCRTAKQFEQFNQSDNRRLFPNLRWLPSRSADPRELHMLFWNKVWSKDDDFWNHNTPGSLWNCKCDWEETDDPVTENPTGPNKSAKGLKGNPATTGEVFSNDHPYFIDSLWNIIKPCVRQSLRNKFSDYEKTYKIPEFGKVYVDSLNVIEVSKGSATDSSYFTKMEIIQNVDKYISKMVFDHSEEIDLSHNNPRNIFYRRKILFDRMDVYKLEIGEYTFVLKFGRFSKTGDYNLYVITG